jgi:hypothetical protein
LLEALGRLEGRDTEVVQQPDLVLGLLLKLLAGLAPLLEGLGLLLKDPGEPGRRERADPSGTRRDPPP